MISTHVAFKKLTKHGMSEGLAEAVTEIMEKQQDDLVTKSDLNLAVSKLEAKLDTLCLNLETKISILNLNISWVKGLSLAALVLLFKIAFFR